MRCNQEKRGRTPYEWFDADKAPVDWEKFVAGFEGLKEMKGLKKRNFRLKDAVSVEDKFKARNLTDTRWASRLMADELKRIFPAPEGARRIFARPGAITSKLRRAWGLESLKKVDGERVSDDRHHAIDAIVLAVTTESLLQAMTREIQRRENEGRADDIFHVAPPWERFRAEAERVVYGDNGIGGVFVSRAERRRARGKAHDATVKQVREIDGEAVVFERKAIEKLTDKDLERIPTPAPYGTIVDPARLRDRIGRIASGLDRRRQAKESRPIAAFSQGRHHSKGPRRHQRQGRRHTQRRNGRSRRDGARRRVPQGGQKGTEPIFPGPDLPARDRDNGHAADARRARCEA